MNAVCGARAVFRVIREFFVCLGEALFYWGFYDVLKSVCILYSSRRSLNPASNSTLNVLAGSYQRGDVVHIPFVFMLAYIVVIRNSLQSTRTID